MRRVLQGLPIALAATLLLSACPSKEEGKGGEPAKGATAAGGNIADVNGQPISKAEFDKQLERTQARFKQANREMPPALEARLKENILRRIVEDELVAQKAKAEGVAMTNEEFETRFAEHRKRFGTDQAYQDFLKRTGQSEEELRAELQKSLLRERLYAKLVPEVEPSDADVKTYFDQNAQRYAEPEQVQASHILLKYQASDPDNVKKEKIATCKKLTADAKKKGADFAELAKKSSEGPTASRGGDLGFFPRGRMVKEFDDAAFTAKAGSILGPIETQFGCHVVKVFEKKEARQKPFDEVKASIAATLKAIKKSEATRNLLNDLRKDAKVTVNDPTLKYSAPPEPVQGVPMGGPAGGPMPAPGAPVVLQPGSTIPVPTPPAGGAAIPVPPPHGAAPAPAPAQAGH